MRWRCAWGVLLSVLLLAGSALWAQEITGSIAGTVKDPSGAVISGATVTIRNTDQNIVVRALKTDSKGDYTATYLPIGHYSVTVESEGFKKSLQKGIELNVNDKLMINATLQMGQASQVVEVQAAPLQVELRSAETSGLVTGNQIRELSLNNRNFTQLVTLMPGVSNTGSEEFYVGFSNPITGGVNTLGISVNGARTSSNNWTLDGADNVDRGSNLGLLVNPSVDSIAEFKVLRSNYSAENGRSGAAQVNVITKSGTSSFHGGAYEFWRNENLNADTYSSKENFRYWTPTADCKREFATEYAATGFTPDCDTRKPMRYHNFGWNLGGPVTIPGVYNKNKDKTFFFFSQEYRRVISYTTGANATLPTSSELQGLMEAPVCVAFNADGSCASGGYSTTIAAANAMSSKSWDISQGYIKDVWSKMPALPSDPLNRAMAFGTFRNVANYREELVKIDHTFGPKLAVYGRYTHDSIPTVEPQGLFGPYTPVPGVSTTQTNAPGWGFVGRATATFSPNTLLEAGYNYSYGAIISDPTGSMNAKNSPDVPSTSIFPIADYLHTLPTINYNGYFSNLSTHPYYEDFNRNHQVFANLTKIRGRHAFKFGATYYHYQKAENFAGANVPTIYIHRYGAFDPTGAGVTPPPGGQIVPCTSTPTVNCLLYNGKQFTQYNMRELQNWANFMMGRVNQVSQSSVDLYPDIRDNQFEAFAQDEWRLRPNLTVTYGLRYSNFRQPTDARGMLTNFDPKYYDPAQAPKVDPTTGYISNYTTANLLNGVVPTDAALKTCQSLLAGKQVPYCWADGTTAPYGSKGGNEYNLAFAPRIGIAWDPFGDGKTSIRSGYALFYDTGLFGIFEQNIFYNPPFVQSLTVGSSSSLIPVPLDNPTGNLTLSQIPKRVDSRVDPNYHTPYNQNWNLGVQRQITASTLIDIGYVGSRANHLLGIMDINQPQPGAYLNYPVLGNAQDFLGATANCTAAQLDNARNAARNGDYSVANKYCSTNFTKLNLLRPYQGWGPINGIRTYAMSNYHALQASLEKRFKGASVVGVAYTWSKALTDNQTDRSTAPPDSYHPHDYYGATQQDRRHMLTANFVYELPWMKSQKGILGKLAGGWEFSGISVIQSGVPYTVTDSWYAWDFAGQGCRLGATMCGIRPDIIGDPTASAAWKQTANVVTDSRVFGRTYNSSSWGWFNPAAFTTANHPFSTQLRAGTSGPGVVYGPGMYRQDLSLFKNLSFSERVKAQLRFEAFNVFNHTNPLSLNTGWANFNETSTSKFGQVALSGDANFKINRELQLGLKINF